MYLNENDLLNSRQEFDFRNNNVARITRGEWSRGSKMSSCHKIPSAKATPKKNSAGKSPAAKYPRAGYSFHSMRLIIFCTMYEYSTKKINEEFPQ